MIYVDSFAIIYNCVLQPRPHMTFTFENILSHINTIYVLRTKMGLVQPRGKARSEIHTPEQDCLRLKVGIKLSKTFTVIIS